ncbi:MAG: hypothetical protein ACRDQZ_13615 [Mycobacteriales bacterium]
MKFFREVFEARGPVPVDELTAVWKAHELRLAREAPDLVAADICATTKISSPNIDVRREDDLLIVSFNGNYQTPPMFSMRSPESICEVAENLRDHVMDEVGSVWPVCPVHDRALQARPVDGLAVWVCAAGDHERHFAVIGELPDLGGHIGSDPSMDRDLPGFLDIVMWTLPRKPGRSNAPAVERFSSCVVVSCTRSASSAVDLTLLLVRG